jgi:hypothetical protein
MSDNFHYNITYFPFCQHHAGAPQTETCQAPRLTVHTTMCITYTTTFNLSVFMWNIQQFWPALHTSQELLLSCYILSFYDFQSVITIHSGSLLHPIFLSHPFTPRKHTKNECSCSTTPLICIHSTNSNSFTLHLLATKQLLRSMSSEFLLTYLGRRRICLLFCRFIKGRNLKVHSRTFFSLKNCITSVSCTN